MIMFRQSPKHSSTRAISTSGELFLTVNARVTLISTSYTMVSYDYSSPLLCPASIVFLLYCTVLNTAHHVNRSESQQDRPCFRHPSSESISPLLIRTLQGQC
jgi:hypothetical protein